ncbi:MAG: L-ribulokinase, partial [Chlorobi bacterium OLB7]
MPFSKVRCSIGLDFGTESGRAVVVDCSTGEILGTATHRYADGVIDEHLPGTSIRLGPDWALQNPDDYLQVLRHAIPEALRQAGIAPTEVVGLGVDFTACTILPTLADGTPLCQLPTWRGNPHAWVKLWKHHAAQPDADRITAVAADRAEPWLHATAAKSLANGSTAKPSKSLREAPEIYAAAERIAEAGDWVVWQLTGREVRNACAAGYKGLWERGNGYPSEEFLAALDPRLADLNRSR